MMLSSLRKPRSIFAYTLLLVMGVVIAVSLGSIGLIMLRPPPNSPPISAYEVARLVQGKVIAAGGDKVHRFTANSVPTPANGERNSLMEIAVSSYLHQAPGDVRFFQTIGESSWSNSIRSSLSRYGPRIQRYYRHELELYGPEGQFNPRFLGSFTVAARQPDGRWRVVERNDADPFQDWQQATVNWIMASVLLAFPFALLFSRRLAKPIRAFAHAAERIGRNQLVEPVKPQGPSEIRLAAEALNDMQARLQRFISERTSVVGAIAHDLRTPLSRLHFHLESAPDELKSKVAAEIAEMEAMIAATLEFVQNEGRRQPSEPIDLSLLVEGVVDDLTDLGHQAELVEGTNAVVRGDPVLLKRLFANLIMNAVTYGNRAQVWIAKENGTAIVDIADEGPGLSEEDIRRAFEPFYRAEGSRNRSTGGIGLGLAIVQSAAHAHGGSVTLSNRPEGGLRARVTLPVGK